MDGHGRRCVRDAEKERETETENLEDAMLLEEDATSQGMQEVSRSWKRPGKESPLKPQERSTAFPRP